MAMMYLRDLREAHNLSQEAVAFDAEISVSQLSRYETGQRDPKLKDLQRIAKRLKVTVATLIGEASARQIPLLSWVNAGTMAESQVITEDQVDKFMLVSDLPSGDWIALEVKGDSMDRIAPNGSIIYVNRLDKKLVQNGCYVIQTFGGEATFKRYRPRPDRFLPYSTNSDHEPFPMTREHQILGRVRRVVNDLF